MENREPTLRQLTSEDLERELDKSIENGNNLRRNAVLREMDRRSEEDNIELK